MRLPTYQDIAADANEMAIYSLPLRGKYLITGPPGSGKTIMALYRAQHVHQRASTSRIALVVYNNTLCRYVSDAAETLKLNGMTSTWHSWFGRFYRDVARSRYPASAGNPYVPDWTQVARVLTPERCHLYRLQHLLIDEAQDLHPMFFALLYRFAENTTVFADMNQQIRENENTLLRDIRASLVGYEERVLTRNYRNTKEIAAVANRFYAGMPTGMCDPPTRSGPMPVVTPCDDLNGSVERIAGYARAHGNLSIGVVVKAHPSRTQYFNRLRHRLGARVQTYGGKADLAGLSFAGNQITVLCLASVKGLEFDAVFLDLPYQSGPLNELQKMELYVASSRPREHLEFLHEGDAPSWIRENLDGVVRFASGTAEENIDSQIF